MKKLFVSMLDVFFPPSDDALMVRALSEEDIRLLLDVRTIRGVRVLSPFEKRYVQALIHEAKFYGNTHAQKLLAKLLDSYLASCDEEYDVIIPIPLSSTRLRTRGYNQVTEILRYVDQSYRKKVKPRALKRTRDTVAQTSLTREERLNNMKDVFKSTKPERVRGKHVLIVDDVSTTGATLNAAKAALLPHFPTSITLLALAH